MDKITLSLHNPTLKQQIKEYAQKKGLTVSALVENYLQNLLKAEKKEKYKLPAELHAVLDGIDVYKTVQKKDYKSLRNEMYENRTK